VESGKRFRLRLVGGLCTICGVQISIENHDMTLIATDGTPVKPATVRSVDIFSGTDTLGGEFKCRSSGCDACRVVVG